MYHERALAKKTKREGFAFLSSTSLTFDWNIIEKIPQSNEEIGQ